MKTFIVIAIFAIHAMMAQSAVVVVRRPPAVVVRPPPRPVVVVRPGRDFLALNGDSDNFKFLVSVGAKKIEFTIGNQQRIACDIEPRLNELTPNLKLNLLGLTVAWSNVNNVDTLSLLSKKSTSENRFTFIDPSTVVPVALSIYSDESVQQSGFLVRDPTCFNAIAAFVKEAKSLKVDFTLV